jgi:hypothetical protein
MGAEASNSVAIVRPAYFAIDGLVLFDAHKVEINEQGQCRRDIIFHEPA